MLGNITAPFLTLYRVLNWRNRNQNTKNKSSSTLCKTALVSRQIVRLQQIVCHCMILVVLGPLCYKLINVVNYYVETGLSCIVY